MDRLTAPEQRLVRLIQIGLGYSNNFSDLPILDQMEWAEIARLADQHDIAAWLYVALKENGRHNQLPTHVLESLRTSYLKRSVNYELRRSLLERVLPVLAEAGIRPILLKGAMLTYTVYPDPICRGMDDLDLWVTENEMPRAQVILESMGYRLHEKSTRPIGFQKRNRGEVQFVSAKKTDRIIELHWSAFPGEWIARTANVDEEGVRVRAQVIKVEKQDAFILSPEDTVIQLATHFAVSHQLSVHWLRALDDIVLVCQTCPVDWDQVIERAKAWRLANVVYVVLRLTHELTGNPNTGILKRLEPSLPKRIALAKLADLPSVVRMRTLSSGSLRFAFLILLVDRLPDAMRLVGRTFLPEREWLLARYGCAGFGTRLEHLGNAVKGQI